MSYEGYNVLLCAKGHRWDEDVHAARGKGKCPACGGEPVWFWMVDTTNDDGLEPSLKLAADRRVCKCLTCGDVHVTEPERFEIPNDHRTASRS